MNRISSLLVAIPVVGVLALAFYMRGDVASADQPRPVRQWEHMAMTVEGGNIGNADVSRKIIGVGREGWELVDVESFVKGGTTNKVVYFFKRPKK